jgi:hypothetical protein
LSRFFSRTLASISLVKVINDVQSVPRSICQFLHPDSAQRAEVLVADPCLPEILSKLGGRFAADVRDILQKQADPNRANVTPERQLAPVGNPLSEHQQFALLRLRAGNTQGAIDYIQRHAPELTGWLSLHLPQKRIDKKQWPIGVVRASDHPMPFVDPEVGRIAYVLGMFGIYRAWGYGHAIDNGDGWVTRAELEQCWQEAEIATSERHRRRLLKQGTENGFWTVDQTCQRIYLTGQVKLSTQMVRQAITSGLGHLLETNKPGKRRVAIDLSGSMQQAAANLYTGWLSVNDPKQKGKMISRETLCQLWKVSVPTLLKWEALSTIRKQANFAQSNETHTSQVPAHAYLTLNRDGSHAVAWRLPNTYFVGVNLKQGRTGKSKRIRQRVSIEMAAAEQRGLIRDAAWLGSGRLYFREDASHNADPFRACDAYLRKRSRQDLDVFQRRYFYVGRRHGVDVYEPYNLTAQTPTTSIFQRLIWQEGKREFQQAKVCYHQMLQDQRQYNRLFA